MTSNWEKDAEKFGNERKTETENERKTAPCISTAEINIEHEAWEEVKS